jgi:uncharacterized protein YbjT (DUF2867 family)
MKPTIKNQGSKVLVTGASGLSGSLAIKEFEQRGTPVKALVRDRSKVEYMEGNPMIEIVEGNMDISNSLSQALEGVESVFLISSADSRMLETQCNFIDACKKAGVRHVLKFSGAEPDFDAQKFLFTRMHEQIEDYLETSGMQWTHLRPSQFMQVYLREARTINEDDAFYLPFGNIELAPVDVSDVVKMGYEILTGTGYEGRSFNVTGPEALTMDQVAQRISKAAGRTIRYVPITIEARAEKLIAAGVPSYMVNALNDQARERLKRTDSRLCLDAYTELNVRPTYFEEFAVRNAIAFQKEKQLVP